jgi:hypothetical protein
MQTSRRRFLLTCSLAHSLACWLDDSPTR